jgi:hypothetical protein
MIAFGNAGLARLYLKALVGYVVVAVGQLAILDIENEAAVIATHAE